MRMKAFCEATGLSRDTVDFYVGRGLLTPSAQRNGYRDFDEAQVERARMIVSAKTLGFTLSEILDLARRYGEGMDDGERAAVLRQQLERLRDRRAAMDRLENGLRDKLRKLERPA